VTTTKRGGARPGAGQPGQTPDNQQGERNEGDDDMGGQFHGPGNQRVQNARAALETHF